MIGNWDFIKMKNYQATMRACFTGYVVQAVINNLVPLLFLTFQREYQIPLSQITLLITLNFGLQLLVDFASAFFIDKIGYRTAVVLALFFSAGGLLALTVFPSIFPNAFAGILAAVLLYALGGGLLEVLISPIVESCPTDNKEKAMSMLHSFYCWGSVGVIILSTAFFACFGTAQWKVLTALWSLLPLANAFVFTRVPIAPLIQDGETSLSIRALTGQKIFWVMLLLMFTAGACEQAVSQWASTFAEAGLGITKALGDLAGPAFFAFLMGVSRTIFGKFGEKIDLKRFMLFSGILCAASYLLIVFSPLPVFSLLGFGVCGLSVGILWPGTFSIASAAIRRGGTALFAFLALAGDLGCLSGPSLVGFVSSAYQNNLRAGILVAIIFPLLLIMCVGRMYAKSRRTK
jgi:fucose permease